MKPIGKAGLCTAGLLSLAFAAVAAFTHSRTPEYMAELTAEKSSIHEYQELSFLQKPHVKICQYLEREKPEAEKPLAVESCIDRHVALGAAGYAPVAMLIGGLTALGMHASRRL